MLHQVQVQAVLERIGDALLEHGLRLPGMALLVHPAQPFRNSQHVCVHGERGKPEGEQDDARSRLRPHAREAGEILSALGARPRSQPR